MDKAKRIEAAWESYRQRVIPHGASQVQITETRNGFYAGALSLFSAIMTTLDPGDEATDADLQVMAEIQTELDSFVSSKQG
jgi:hypothetical protein